MAADLSMPGKMSYGGLHNFASMCRGNQADPSVVPPLAPAIARLSVARGRSGSRKFSRKVSKIEQDAPGLTVQSCATLPLECAVG